MFSAGGYVHYSSGDYTGYIPTIIAIIFSLSDLSVPQDMLIVHALGFLGLDPETLFLSSVGQTFSGARAIGMCS